MEHTTDGSDIPTPTVQPINDLDGAIAEAQVALEQPAFVQRGHRLGRLFGRLREAENNTDTEYYSDIPREQVKAERIPVTPETVASMQDYLMQLFPGEVISLLSTEASSAMVFQDQNDRVYKAMRSNAHYTYDEKEMSALALLNKEGIAPKPLLFVDIPYAQRHNTAGMYQPNVFSENAFPRIETNGTHPVAIMEKIDFDELETVDDETFLRGFDSFYEVAQKHGLIFGDLEIVFDKARGQLTLLDAGGMGKVSPDMRNVKNMDGQTVQVKFPELSDEAFMKIEITKWLLHSFGISTPNSSEELKALVDGGMPKIHDYIKAARGRVTRQ